MRGLIDGLLLTADNIDFMVHGLFDYSFFGHTVYITTTHVSIVMVMLILIIFSIIATITFLIRYLKQIDITIYL